MKWFVFALVMSLSLLCVGWILVASDYQASGTGNYYIDCGGNFRFATFYFPDADVEISLWKDNVKVSPLAVGDADTAHVVPAGKTANPDLPTFDAMYVTRTSASAAYIWWGN